MNLYMVNNRNETIEQKDMHLKKRTIENILDQVNEIRLQNGLTKLPHIQQELEARMAK